MNLGQEVTYPPSYVSPERPPNDHELALWNRADELKRRVVSLATIMRLRHRNLMYTSKYCAARGIIFPTGDLPALENRMLAALEQIEILRKYCDDVNGQKLGVRLSASGADLDILSPEPASSTTMGALWVPIIVGVVILAGIISRWLWVEKETNEISEKYNGQQAAADKIICANPSSPQCGEWKAAKKTGEFKKNVTLIESVKSAIGKIGGGLSTGLLLLIPILALLYLPRRAA